MKFSRSKSLPVIMYHYVNDFAGSITLSPGRFEEHCRVLAENGWHGVSLSEAENFLIHSEPLPARSVLFTFDDGFCDNYLNALPLLRKYGHKGVVFAVSNRLESTACLRAATDEVVAGKTRVPDNVSRPVRQTVQGFSLREDVFVTHAEARQMDEEGTLALASHGRGHYGVFAGPDYTGFRQPGTCLRTFYRTEDAPLWGMPDFQVKPGLLHRAFVPNPDLTKAVSDLVPQDFDAAASFFASEDNIRSLKSLLEGFADRLGRFETDEERRHRMWREIAGGKEELEAILGHEVKTLCWPWGKYSPEAWDLAREAGFKLFFTTREGVNPPGRPEAVSRFKGKDKSGSWLLSRARIYSRPLLGKLYAKVRL